MRTPEPDLDGFAEAQTRFRGQFGDLVTFYGDPVVTLPPGTPVDPETGRPYDPVVQGSAVVPSATATCNVAWQANQHESGQSPAGRMDRTDLMLICEPATSAIVASAREFDVHGQRFKIVASKRDSRWLTRIVVYGRRR